MLQFIFRDLDLFVHVIEVYVETWPAETGNIINAVQLKLNYPLFNFLN